MPSGVQQFTRQQIAQAARDTPELPQAVVQSIATGAGSDGGDVVTVTYRGTAIKVPHNSAYTPAVGHVVLLARSAGTWVILCRLSGFPTAP